jgi:hypothetical protein
MDAHADGHLDELNAVSRACDALRRGQANKAIVGVRTTFGIESAIILERATE